MSVSKKCLNLVLHIISDPIPMIVYILTGIQKLY